MYISGTPYTENNITQMSISTTSQEESGSLLFAVPSRTPSSTIPNDDPSTANRSRTHEPLKTRNSYQVIDEETNSPCLAMHAAPLGTAVGGTIRVGDEVVLDGGDQHLYNKDLTEEAWTEI
jgi:hypothetical protein